MTIPSQTGVRPAGDAEGQWRELFEHSPLMYFMVDPAGTVIAVNAFGAAQLGYTVSELVGQSVLKVFFPDDKEAAAKKLELCVQTLGQQNKWEIRKTRKDGTLLWVRENAKAIRQSDGNLIVLIACEDISDRKRGEQRLAAQYGVTRVLAESDSLAEATPNLLRSICEAMDWDWGALWSGGPQAEHLRCDFSWHATSIDSAEFDAATRDLVFAPGEGRAGQVWQTRQPFWIADVTKDPGFRRGAAAAKAGLHSGLACPILLGREALGIIEFFSRPVREPHEQELATLAAIGSQIGQFIQRKRAEHAVVASEKRFRALIEHAYDVVLLVTAEGTILYASPSMEMVLGYAPEELIGRDGFVLIHPDHRQESIDRFSGAVQQPAGVVTGERLLLHKDGSARWVENVIVNLLSDPSVQAVVMHLRDVTERKRAEEALRDSEQRFRDYAEIASDWLWESGPDHRFRHFTRSSASWGFGTEFIGVRRWDLAADWEEEPEKWRAHIATLDAHQPFRGFRYRASRPDGSALHVSASGKPVFDADGKFLGYRGVATDISAEIRADQAEQALREAQSQLEHVTRVTTLGELAASIAHEMNQPLAAVVADASASLRWLDAQVPNLGEARQSLGRIINAANRAAEVIGRIRALTRKTPVQKEELDVNEVIREVTALTRTEMGRTRVNLRTQLGDDLPLVQADRIELQQVVLNLVINAIEAMADSPRRELLIMSMRDYRNDVRVLVCDSGRGFDAAAADRIFEAFYTTKLGGMGMGLAICRSIIESLGGRLSARANTPCGSIFEFSIPSEQATVSA